MSVENVIKIVFRGTMTPMSGFEDIRISGPVGLNGVELSLSLERCHQECKVKISEVLHSPFIMIIILMCHICSQDPWQSERYKPHPLLGQMGHDPWQMCVPPPPRWVEQRLPVGRQHRQGRHLLLRGGWVRHHTHHQADRDHQQFYGWVGLTSFS